MPINAVLDVKEEYPLYGYTEPVTLQEVKDYCKIDFDDEDSLLTRFITAARENLEKYLGVSIVQKNLTVIVNNEDGGIEIPYGPTPGTIDVTAIIDIEGNVIETQWILITGNDFKQLQTPCWPYIQMNYTAGYVPVWQSLTEGGVVLPEDIRFAIMALVFDYYEHRNDREGPKGMPWTVTQFCNKYKRNTELSL